MGKSKGSKRGRSRSKKGRDYAITIFTPDGEVPTHHESVTHLKCDDGSISFYEDGLKCKTNLAYIAKENAPEEEGDEAEGDEGEAEEGGSDD